MNRFFTADADRYIGKKVLEYNNAESEEERLRLESFVKERTGILLYIIYCIPDTDMQIPVHEVYQEEGEERADGNCANAFRSIAL